MVSQHRPRVSPRVQMRVNFSALKGRACKSPGTGGPSGLTEARSPKGRGPMAYAPGPVAGATVSWAEWLVIITTDWVLPTRSVGTSFSIS